jgi:pyruvate dehydrogenase E2 component (dihydrolipoamide acetyltransferase)
VRRSPEPSFNDLVVKACVVALREYPRVNAAFSEQDSVTRPRSTSASQWRPRTPPRPGRSRSGREIAQDIRAETRDLAEKARAGSSPADLDGGPSRSRISLHGGASKLC